MEAEKAAAKRNGRNTETISSRKALAAEAKKQAQAEAKNSGTSEKQVAAEAAVYQEKSRQKKPAQKQRHTLMLLHQSMKRPTLKKQVKRNQSRY